MLENIKTFVANHKVGVAVAVAAVAVVVTGGAVYGFKQRNAKAAKAAKAVEAAQAPAEAVEVSVMEA